MRGLTRISLQSSLSNCHPVHTGIQIYQRIDSTRPFYSLLLFLGFLHPHPPPTSFVFNFARASTSKMTFYFRQKSLSLIHYSFYLLLPFKFGVFVIYLISFYLFFKTFDINTSDVFLLN